MLEVCYYSANIAIIFWAYLRNKYMNQKTVNFPVTLSGQWHSPSDEYLSQLSENLKNWLLDENSLTARLKSCCDTFQVKVIGEEQQICTANEACELIKAGEPILVREVLLYCDNVAQVFARSLLPLKSLTGREEALGQLGEQPLGQVLFNNPSLKRQGLELSSFTHDSSMALLAKNLARQIPELVPGKVLDKTPAPIAGELDNALWGRRSIFMIENKPLMVAEVFLPGAFAYQ